MFTSAPALWNITAWEEVNEDNLVECINNGYRATEEKENKDTRKPYHPSLAVPKTCFA